MGGKKQPTACTRLDSRSIGSLAVLVAGVAGRPLHEREVPARRAAGDPDPVRVDVIVLGVMPDEPHGAVHVLEDLGDRVLGLAAVDDREDRVAPLEQLVEEAGVDPLVRREPAAADGPDHRRAVGVRLGREDVHRQRACRTCGRRSRPPCGRRPACRRPGAGFDETEALEPTARKRKKTLAFRHMAWTPVKRWRRATIDDHPISRRLP